MNGDTQLRPYGQRMFPQQGMSESNEKGLPVMSMHNAKMVTLTLNMMKAPRSSDHMLQQDNDLICSKTWCTVPRYK